ncbi:MAG: GntR family transcriptional regulator [Methylobacteriaceae bacterium]|nr:GntR family transcriptional regulator [Methylobacteriaceae bacterium]
MTSIGAVEDIAAGPEVPAGWQKVRPRTLVSQAAEAILAAVSRGLLLPGDRVVENDIAAALGVSRVPVREALRMLEQQGVVMSEPYRGMRLVPLTRSRLDEIVEVRIALETAAARRALILKRNTPAAVRGLERAIDELELMAVRGDSYGLGSADAAFHHEFCRLSGNEMLCTVWQSIAVQVTITVGLSTLVKSMDNIVEEHRELLGVFMAGSAAKLGRAIEDHVRVQNAAVDFEGLIAERRKINGQKPGAGDR